MTAIPQTNHAFHPFHASSWGVDLNMFKTAYENPAHFYEMTEHAIQQL